MFISLCALDENMGRGNSLRDLRENMSIRRNTLMNLVGAGASILVLLVTVPVYLAVIGEEHYGVLAIVWLLLGYFGLFHLGVGTATANQIAKLRDSRDSQRQAVFWAAIIVNAAFGILGGLILWWCGHYFLASYFSDKMPRSSNKRLYAPCHGWL
jgi:O-antigen/teichoic acid export membrane protein